MISTLVSSTVDDRPLTDEELYQLGFLLYLAGLDTVANVLTYSASAGRDDRQYRDPDEFRLDRFAKAHMAFGAGPHRCAGAHLARLELRIALEEWHRRFPDYELADDQALTEYVGAVAGLTALPLRWEPTSGRPPCHSRLLHNEGDPDD